uniref:Uncharacterized protein n=1 Tax=Panagrolaimus sp. JU765 TaxID=591449 RepID=A0AC34R5R8_9BILA
MGPKHFRGTNFCDDQRFCLCTLHPNFPGPRSCRGWRRCGRQESVHGWPQRTVDWQHLSHFQSQFVVDWNCFQSDSLHSAVRLHHRAFAGAEPEPQKTTKTNFWSQSGVKTG